MTECGARVTDDNEDGYLRCDLDELHLGAHLDKFYGATFWTPGMDAA